MVRGTGSTCGSWIWAFAFFLYCLSSALCSSSWRKKARLIEPRLMVGLNVLELQTAKEILAEVFHTRPADVEETIQRWLPSACIRGR